MYYILNTEFKCLLSVPWAVNRCPRVGSELSLGKCIKCVLEKANNMTAIRRNRHY